MADKKNRYYWIKLKKNFFDEKDGPIDFIMSQENGSQYIVLYLMMCLNTANTDGLLCNRIGEMIVPYDIEKIVRDTKFFSFDTVAVALELFKKLGMVYEEENGVLKIANIHEMVGSESASKEAIKKREYRLKKKISQYESNEIQVITDKDIKDDIPKTKSVSKNVNYQQIVDNYNNICVSLQKVIKISEKRKKMISARLNMYTEDELIDAFKKAEQSDFLKGANSRNWKADFEWIMSDKNIIKVLEGKYDNSTHKNTNKAMKSNNKFNNFTQRNYTTEELDELEKRLLSR